MIARKEIPCRKCGKPIVFVLTPKGHKMPCDPEPQLFENDEPKTVLVLDDGVSQHGVKKGDLGFIPHWATCSEPDSFRRSAKGGRL